MGKALGLAFAFAAALVGAGFASGREIIWFFSMFGVWSWVGIVFAAVICGFITWKLLSIAKAYDANSIGLLCEKVLGIVGGRICAGLFALLMLTTCAAMIAASGEIGMVVIGNHAYMPVACAITLLGALIARKGFNALSKAGAWLMPLTIGLFFLLMFVPGRSGVARQPIHNALLFGSLYSALNMALSSGIICEAGVTLSKNQARLAAVLCGAVFFILLTPANIVLLRHAGGLLEEPVPTILLGKWWGPAGLLFVGCVLWMAILTTISTTAHTLVMYLTALGIKAGFALAAFVLVSFAIAMIGFENLVGIGYTALGFISVGMLGAIIIRGWK